MSGPIKDTDIDEHIMRLTGELAELTSGSWMKWACEEWPALANAIEAITVHHVKVRCQEKESHMYVAQPHC